MYYKKIINYENEFRDQLVGKIFKKSEFNNIDVFEIIEGTQGKFVSNDKTLAKNYDFKLPWHSGHFNPDKKRTELNGITLHFTVGYLWGDMGLLTGQGDRKDSYITTNFLIARNGDIYMLHPINRYGWHLGSHLCPTSYHKNNLGIEISCIGVYKKYEKNNVTKYSHSGIWCKESDTQAYVDLGYNYRGYQYFPTYTPQQYDSIKKLLLAINTYKSSDLPNKTKLELLPQKIRGEFFGPFETDKKLQGIREKLKNKELLSQSVINQLKTEQARLQDIINKWDEKIESLYDDINGKYWNRHELMNFNGITTHVNWKSTKIDLPPAPAFEYNRIIDKSISDFPIRNKLETVTPLSYFTKSESSNGGYYPIGLSQTLHGGIHIKPEKGTDKTEVKAIAPGYIVAVRLNAEEAGRTKDEDGYLYKFIKNYTSFILIRHEFGEVNDKGKVIKKSKFPLYSLYMHLKPPKWFFNAEGEFNPPEKVKLDLKKTPEYAKIKWLKQFAFSGFNGVLSLDFSEAAKKRFGHFYWTSEDLGNNENCNKKFDSCQVYEKDGLNTFTINRKVDDKTVGIAKQGPEEIRKAFKGLINGSVVVFDQPFLKVEKGELIGYVSEIDHKFNGFLHWEIFSPFKDIEEELNDKNNNNSQNSSSTKSSNETTGVEKLIKLISNLDINESEFKSFEEAKNQDDNFLEGNELKKIFDELPDKVENKKLKDFLADEVGYYNDNIEQRKLFIEEKRKEIGKADASFISLVINDYKKAVNNYYKSKHTSGFILDGKTYSSIVNIKIPKNSQFDDGTDDDDDSNDCMITVEANINGGFKFITKKSISEFHNGIDIKIPHDAVEIKLSSNSCHLEVFETDYLKNEINAFKENLKYRLRNFYIDHNNEWTQEGLKTLLEKLYDRNFLSKKYIDKETGKEKQDSGKDAVVKRYFKGLYPLTWWGIPESGKNNIIGDKDDKGIISVFKSKKSFIKIMQESKEVMNIHPVTAVWMINLLSRKGKIRAIDHKVFEPKDDKNKIMYYNWHFKNENVSSGEEVFAVIIGENYSQVTDSKVKIKFKSDNDEIEIVNMDIKLDEYGVFKYSILPNAWDGKYVLEVDGGAKTEKIAKLDFSIAKPELISYEPEIIEKDELGMFSLTIKIKDPCPIELKGLVYFEYKRNDEWKSYEKPIGVIGKKIEKKSEIIFNIDENELCSKLKDEYIKDLEDKEKIKLRCRLYIPGYDIDIDTEQEEPIAEGEDISEIFRKLVDEKIDDVKKRDHIVIPEQKENENKQNNEEYEQSQIEAGVAQDEIENPNYIHLDKVIEKIGFIDDMEFYTNNDDYLIIKQNFTASLYNSWPGFKMNGKKLKTNLYKTYMTASIYLPKYAKKGEITFETYLRKKDHGVEDINNVQSKYNPKPHLEDDIDIVGKKENNIYKFSFKGKTRAKPNKWCLLLEYEINGKYEAIRNSSMGDKYGNVEFDFSLPAEVIESIENGNPLKIRWRRMYKNNKKIFSGNYAVEPNVVNKSLQITILDVSEPGSAPPPNDVNSLN